MPADRFRWLENKGGLPDELKKSLAGFNRFGNLELPQSAAKAAQRRCPGCDAAVDQGAVDCPACRRVLEPEPQVVPQGAELAVILDGKTYRSTDKSLPDDVAELIRRIRAQGYSKKLLADWLGWRATRRARLLEPAKPVRPVPALRVNGRLVRWSESACPEELRVLMSFIAVEGVTPPLLHHLDELGLKARFEPAAAGGLGELSIETGGASGLSPAQRLVARFVVIAAAVWLVLRPFAGILPETLQPLTWLLPLGCALAWAFR